MRDDRPRVEPRVERGHLAVRDLLLVRRRLRSGRAADIEARPTGPVRRKDLVLAIGAADLVPGGVAPARFDLAERVQERLQAGWRRREGATGRNDRDDEGRSSESDGDRKTAARHVWQWCSFRSGRRGEHAERWLDESRR